MSDLGPGSRDPAEELNRSEPGKLIEHDARLCGLATNPALPKDILNVLIDHGDAALLQDIAQRTD